MEFMVASMFTTTPFFNPREGCVPMPTIFMLPSSSTSATMATIFEVPISSPTMRSWLSFTLSPSCFSFCVLACRSLVVLDVLRDAGGEAVAIAHVDVVDRAGHARDSDRIENHKAGEPLGGFVAAQSQRKLVVERQLPTVPGREAYGGRRSSDAAQSLAEIAI